MDIFADILAFLQAKMETPTSYGWFHLLCWGVVIGLSVLLCTKYRKCSGEVIRKVVFYTAVLTAVLEAYKQFVFSFHFGDNGVYFDFQWYSFPWQFCSSPMYVGLLTGIFRKGKVHDALFAYLATYSLFAGLCVMFYPNDVFISMIGINIQTMVWHGGMVVIGVWLLATQYVKLEHKTILKAACVFTAVILVAIIMNEVAWYTGITGGETFNMFYISRHYPGSLPVYSLVQEVVPYPWCLAIYIAAFTLAAHIVLMIAMLCKRIALRRREKAIA